MTPSELKSMLKNMQNRSLELIISLAKANHDMTEVIAAIDNCDYCELTEALQEFNATCRYVADSLEGLCDSAARFL